MIRLFASLVLILVCLTGCSVKSRLTINSDADGTGSIEVQATLDKEASDAVPDLKSQLQVADLEAAGWSISGPDRHDDGSTTIEAHHSFNSDVEAQQLVSQVAGPEGPFRDFTLSSKRSWLSTHTTFSGTVDLRRGIESFGDPALRERFGLGLGVDPAEVSEGLGVDWARSFPIEVKVNLPGSRFTASPATDDGVWNPPYNSATSLSATGTGLNWAPFSLIIVAVLAALGAGIVALVWKPVRYLGRHAAGSHGVRAKDLLAAKEQIQVRNLDESRLVFNEEGAARTADVLAFAPGETGGWKVLLIERGGEPFAGRLAMPGGFMDKEPPERAGEAAARELNEETGLAVRPPSEEEDEQPPISLEPGRLAWLGRYDTPGRDPRGATASDTYVVVLDEEPAVQGADDAARAEFVSVNDLLEQMKSSPTAEGVLAFDHDLAVLDALEMLRRFGVAPPS